METNIIIEKLRESALCSSTKDKIVYSIIETGEKTTYYELFIKTKQYSEKLKENNLKDIPVILLNSHDINSIALILACIDCHCIPVIKNYDNNTEKFMFKISNFIKNTQSFQHIVSSFDFKESNDIIFKNYNILNVEKEKAKENYAMHNYQIKDNSIIFQETSGTTGTNKLVLLNNNQMRRTLNKLSQCINTEQFNNLSFLPFSHILGLITTIFLTIYKSGTTYIMQPKNFKKYPNKWLNLISINKINFIACSNNNLEYIIQNFESGKYDFNELKTIYIGGEPVRYSTIKNFYKLLKNYNLSKKVFVPSYGMTEMCGPICHDDSRNLNFSINKDLVSCGRPEDEEVKVLLLKENGEISYKENNQCGEILLSSKNLFNGYHNNYLENFWVTHNGEKYFNTNDIGFFENDKLYISGKNTNIIIKDGKKISPLEIDQCINFLKGEYGLLNLNVVSIDEKVVLFIEIDFNCFNKEAANDLYLKIYNVLKQKMNLEINDIVFLIPDNVPKTELGKVRVRELKKRYLDGGYNDFINKL